MMFNWKGRVAVILTCGLGVGVFFQSNEPMAFIQAETGDIAIIVEEHMYVEPEEQTLGGDDTSQYDDLGKADRDVTFDITSSKSENVVLGKGSGDSNGSGGLFDNVAEHSEPVFEASKDTTIITEHGTATPVPEGYVPPGVDNSVPEPTPPVQYYEDEKKQPFNYKHGFIGSLLGWVLTHLFDGIVLLVKKVV